MFSFSGISGIKNSDEAKPTRRETVKTKTEANYNATAVEAQIKKDKRIKGKEAKMIHALLKGHSK